MRFYSSQKEFYCGVDMHARSCYICIVDKEHLILVHRPVKNLDTDLFLKLLEPYKHSLVVGAESSFAWYWLADLCEDNDIEFILGHALYMKAIHGGKSKNDRIDSHKIALLIQSGMFPLANVYPRETRALRDLLRRRQYFNAIRGRLCSHVRLLNYQKNLPPMEKITRSHRKRAGLQNRFDDPIMRHSATIDLTTVDVLDTMISKLDFEILYWARDYYQSELAILQSVLGIGDIISLTIILEVGDINRFDTRQQFASYSRLIKCEHTSAGKRCGFGNKKIGNPYLKNAFCEAALLVTRYNPRIAEYKQRLVHKYGKCKSITVLAHKLCRAVYYMLKNKTVFNEDYFLTGGRRQASTPNGSKVVACEGAIS